MKRRSGSKEFFQHRAVAGIAEVLIYVVFDEVEERRQVGVPGTFGLVLSAFGHPVEEGENLIGGYLLQIVFREFFAEFGKDQLVRLDGVFFEMRFLVF